jgi:hypothetical protein
VNTRRLLSLTFLTIVALAAGVPGAASAEDGAPAAYIVNPIDGAAYPQGAGVPFAFYCGSDTSYVVACDGSQPLGSPVDTANAGTHTLSVTATDFEGRQSTTTATYTVIDVTPPHVDFHTPENGTTYDLGAELTYDYACVDDAGGLGIAGCAASLPPGAPLDTSHIGRFTFEVWAFDLALNLGHETVTYTVVDRIPPSITFSSPAEGASYTLGQAVWVSFSCADQLGGSGLNGCKGDLPEGAALDTSALGSKTFTVTAFDRAGNTATETHAYSVVYDFAGFAPPAAPYPTATAVKPGESIPLKFSLHGDQGANIFAAGSPGWAPCGALDGPTPADGTLSYNGSVDRYTYLAATAKAWSGTCRDLIVTLRDRTVHRARFTFGK